MWNILTRDLSPRTKHYQILQDGQVLSWKSVLQLWTDNQVFRSFYHQTLMNSPWEAYFWEHPPVNKYCLKEAYEFVLIDAPRLANVTPEPHTFRTYFEKDKPVAVFSNLGGDAQLVVPAPLSDEHDFGHLARFVCQSRPVQMHAFWQAVGRTLIAKLAETNTWLSTSGMGVYWLHVRLDSRPKYYQYQPYRNG